MKATATLGVLFGVLLGWVIVRDAIDRLGTGYVVTVGFFLIVGAASLLALAMTDGE